MAAINRTPYNALVDDDGSNTVGSIWNKLAIKNVLLDPIDVALVQAGRVVQRTTLTGTQHDFGLSVAGADTLIICNNASLLTLDGIAGGVDGQQVTIVAGNAQVNLPHNSGSTAGNRFANLATSVPTSLVGPSGAAIYEYDATATIWRLIAHEQGGWVDVAFNAANFGATGGFWTVSAGNQARFSYAVMGKTAVVEVLVGGSVTSGTATSLNLVMPFTILVNQNSPVYFYVAPDFGWGVYQQPSQDTFMRLSRDVFGTPFAAASACQIRLTATVQIL